MVFLGLLLQFEGFVYRTDYEISFVQLDQVWMRPQTSLLPFRNKQKQFISKVITTIDTYAASRLGHKY